MPVPAEGIARGQMGSRRNVLDSQAIRDYEDMRLQRGDDPGRWPRYDVEVDDSAETARRATGSLLVDILTVEELDAASAPAGPGEEITLRKIGVGGMSWQTESEEQRDMARLGFAASHARRIQLRGRYADVVRAIVESLAHRGHRLRVLAETTTGSRLSVYVARPWYGGSNGRMTLEIALPPTGAGVVEVEGTTESRGTWGTWTRGRHVLDETLADADHRSQGERLVRKRVDRRRILEVARPKTALQWLWLAGIVGVWAIISMAVLLISDSLLTSAVALVVLGLMSLPAYLFVTYRYL